MERGHGLRKHGLIQDEWLMGWQEAESPWRPLSTAEKVERSLIDWQRKGERSLIT